MRLLVGEAHHDVHVEEAEGRLLARASCRRWLRVWPGSMSWWRHGLRIRARVVIDTEADRGLFVGALVAAGLVRWR